MDDAQVRLLVKAATSFDLSSYVFSPIPQNTDVRLELRPTRRYDAMLHIAQRPPGRSRFAGRMVATSGSANRKASRDRGSTKVWMAFSTKKLSFYPHV